MLSILNFYYLFMKKLILNIVLLIVFLFVSESLISSETYLRAVNISVIIDSSGNTKKYNLSWDNSDTNASAFIISRKRTDESIWTLLDTVPLSRSEYTDENQDNLNSYEYQIIKTTKDSSYMGFGYIYTGYDVKLANHRGIALLLIDDSISAFINDELYRFELDLIGDGYRVIKHYVERTESFSASAVSRTKTFIELVQSEHPSEPLSIILIGRVAVPYSGNTPWDGHNPDHAGAWASDLFYAVERNYWTDINIFNTNPTRIQNKNIPWDGKFDQSVIKDNNVIIGRVDMYNLPDFKEDEAKLLSRYFNKNHAFRHRDFIIRNKALLDDGFQTYLINESFAANGWMNFTSLVGSDNIDTVSYRYSMSDSSYLWSYGCNQGSYNSIYNTAYSEEYAQKEFKSVFTLLLGSYAGDWDSQNNVLRSALASEPSILTAAWSGRPFWFFHHMALGMPVGYSSIITQNNNGLYQFPSSIGLRGIQINLMGDPTLRMLYVSPPGNLTVDSDSVISGSRNIGLSWVKSSDNDVIGYYLFRSNGLSESFELVSSDLIDGTSFIDIDAPDGHLVYMIRAVKKEISVSGSYYNLSQGVLLQIGKPVSVQENEKVIDFLIYPNPSRDFSALSINLSKSGPISISILDVYGYVVSNTADLFLSQGNHTFNLNHLLSVNNLPQGVYFIRIETKYAIELGKFIIID